MKRILAVMLLVVFLFSACTATYVKSGTIRDTIGNVERTYNGNWRVWFTNDTAAGYCTTDDEVGARALDLLMNHDGEVILEYKSIRAGDPEASFWSKSDCGSIAKGEFSMEMFSIVCQNFGQRS